MQVKASDQAEIAAATLQGPEQIWVGVLVGLDDRAVGKYDLVVDDGVGAEANLVTVEVDATGKKETWNTDRPEAATSRS